MGVRKGNASVIKKKGKDRHRPQNLLAAHGTDTWKTKKIDAMGWGEGKEVTG